MKKIAGGAEISRSVVDTKEIGTKAHIPTFAKGGSWVQTERSGHEAWARLSVKSPLAAAVMHVLVSRMGSKNAIVVSQKTLAKIVGVSDRSIRSAVAVLVEQRWVENVYLNGPGTVMAYVVNSAVAWSQERGKLHTAAFTATVIADKEDQKTPAITHRELRKIPMLYSGEMQLPTGEGEEPPSQPALDGMEIDMPSIGIDDDE
jgi:hypothetical protein